MRFEYFPRSAENHYQEVFAAAMGRHGIVMEPLDRIEDKILVEHADRIDGVHFHWIEELIGKESALRRARRIVGLLTFVRCLKRLNKRLIWTVHNHVRHDDSLWIDALAYRVVAKAADLIIVHSDHSGDYIRRKYKPSGKVVVMPHGNYEGFYHPKRSIAETRRAMGLREDRPVCGVIGSVRPYRGHELAIAAAGGWGDKCQLLITGRPYSADYGRQIEASTRGRATIRCHLSRLSHDEYAEAIRACDIILLPYNEVTSSGALLSAWSLGRPVVATALPLFCELEQEQKSRGAIKTAAPTPDAFTRCVNELLATAPSAREAAAHAEADRYSWDTVTASVAQEILSWAKSTASSNRTA